MRHWLRSLALIMAITSFTIALKTELLTVEWWVAVLVAGILFGIFNDMIPDKERK